jgi:hypothetical protein
MVMMMVVVMMMIMMMMMIMIIMMMTGDAALSLQVAAVSRLVVGDFVTTLRSAEDLNLAAIGRSIVVFITLGE